jgi:hypothetical protein
VSEPSIEAAVEAAAKERGDVAAVAVAQGQKHGLHFTREEFVRIVDAARRQQDGDMEDDTLERVVGGLTPQPTPPGNELISGRGVNFPAWLSQNWAREWR